MTFYRVIKYWLVIFFFAPVVLLGQEDDSIVSSNILTYNELLGMVKKHHPMVKQAQLQLSIAQAKLLKARGAFDPKIEVDFDNKEYKGKSYYKLLNGGLKIPTWYGVELKAAFNQSEGIFVNPQNTLPTDGLTSLGITVPIGRDLWINKRMAELKKAKLNIQIGQSQKQMLAIEVIYEASLAYFEWIQSYEKYQLYRGFCENAKKRLQGVKQLVISGDKPAIDSIETGIVLKKRTYQLEKMRLKLLKSQLNVSNFLWTSESIPLELAENLIPEQSLYSDISFLLTNEGFIQNDYQISSNPKLQQYGAKLKVLAIDKQWKSNQLLPELNVGYYYLSEPDLFTQQNFDNYKIGLNFSYSLFLRKERAAYKLAKYKIQDVQYNLSVAQVQLKNKLEFQEAEIKTLSKQLATLSSLVGDFKYMLESENKLFEIGESSIFYINTREDKLLKSKIDQIDLQNQYCISHAKMIRLQANSR